MTCDRDPIGKTSDWSVVNLEKYATWKSSKPEPVIWSHDTGKQIVCCDSCQLTTAWTPKIKDVAMVMVLLS